MPHRSVKTFTSLWLAKEIGTNTNPSVLPIPKGEAGGLDYYKD